MEKPQLFLPPQEGMRQSNSLEILRNPPAVLLVGNVHPDEKVARELFERLEQNLARNPIPYVTTLWGNPLAEFGPDKHQRGVDGNLSIMFGELCVNLREMNADEPPVDWREKIPLYEMLDQPARSILGELATGYAYRDNRRRFQKDYDKHKKHYPEIPYELERAKQLYAAIGQHILQNRAEGRDTIIIDVHGGTTTGIGPFLALSLYSAPAIIGVGLEILKTLNSGGCQLVMHKNNTIGIANMWDKTVAVELPTKSPSKAVHSTEVWRALLTKLSQTSMHHLITGANPSRFMDTCFIIGEMPEHEAVAAGLGRLQGLTEGRVELSPAEIDGLLPKLALCEHDIQKFVGYGVHRLIAANKRNRAMEFHAEVNNPFGSTWWYGEREALILDCNCHSKTDK